MGTPEWRWRRELFQRNQQNMEAWRRKMCCVRAVESVGESGDYRDLRDGGDMEHWLNVCIRRGHVKVDLAALQIVGDPDSSDGAR